MKDTLGDRIKRYERVSNSKLLPNSQIFIRIDGKAFHTFTKGFDKPFSKPLIDTMIKAAQATARQMSGFKLGYVQSDEATFMITDTDTFETQGWFDYEINKLVSISASAFTAYFNREWDSRFSFNVQDENYIPKLKSPAMFDSRAFNVPAEDAPNAFIWRQRDWERNSIQMLARSYFSQKECHGKKVDNLMQMLADNNCQTWPELDDVLKYGTWILKDGSLVHNRLNYNDIQEIIDGAI
jgi:tRNA(His) guanylyltransferase